ncbi:MAG: hypothetical protein C0403_10985, partial [Desulfobacterium sp.]|nr:hypothetical protein [Desulfobacterium sp.]
MIVSLILAPAGIHAILPFPLEVKSTSTTTIFAESEHRHHFRIATMKPLSGDLIARIAAGNRTLALFEEHIDISASATASFSIPFKTPAVKPGIIQPLDLTVSLAGSSSADPVEIFCQRLWIFHRDIFADKHEWLSGLNIILYDPAGKTGRMFAELSLPIPKTANFNVISKNKHDIVLTGENTDLNEKMTSELLKLAAAGAKILCLDPRKFQLSFNPAIEGKDDALPPSLHFYERERIVKLDKRLDASLWWDSGLPDKSIQMKTTSPETININVKKSKSPWVWCEIHFPDCHGRLIVTTLPLSDRMDRNPTPRYLFFAILKSFEQRE